MPLYIEIALGILLALVLLTQTSMLLDLIDRIITAILQLARDILRTLERIFSAAFRAIAR